MTKSELIESIARSQKHLPAKDVELAVKHILELMSEALASGEPFAPPPPPPAKSWGP